MEGGGSLKPFAIVTDSVVVVVPYGATLRLQNPEHHAETRSHKGPDELTGQEVVVGDRAWIIFPNLSDFGMPISVLKDLWDDERVEVYRETTDNTKREEYFNV